MWLHLVDRWFQELTEKRVRWGEGFENVQELIVAID